MFETVLAMIRSIQLDQLLQNVSSIPRQYDHYRGRHGILNFSSTGSTFTVFFHWLMLRNITDHY